MNRILISIGLLAILWFLSACGAAQPATANQATPAQATTIRAPSATPTSAMPVAERIAVGAGSYQRVQAAQFAEMLQHKDFVLVNTHIPYAGEIAATDLFLAYDQIDTQLGQLPADKQAKIVLYCRTGHMSAIAAEALVKAGYTNVWDLAGGMVGWQKSGQTIISK